MMTEATICIAAREKPTAAERATESRGGTVDKTCGAEGAMGGPQSGRVTFFVPLKRLLEKPLSTCPANGSARS
jgi:hypothetical protein